MIQRPQTLLLFVTAILYVLMAFAPLWSLTIEASNVSLSAVNAVLSATLEGKTSILKESSNIYLLATLACGSILSVVSIFFFKDRPLQAKITALNMLVITVFIVLSISIALPNAKALIMSDENGSFEWGFFLTLPIIVCNFIASKLIRKDEKLVRSVDRIR